RDIHARMDPLLYTTSIRKATYLGARFLGSVSAAAVLMSLAIPTGLWIAVFTQSIETELLGPLLPGAYINSALFLTLPNVFIATAIMYASALLLRHSMAAYLGGFIIFLLSTFNLDMVAGNWKLAELIDPSGITIIDEISSTLTPVELNTKLVALKGYLLANRVLWVAISVLAGLIVYYNFHFSHHVSSIRWRKARGVKAGDPIDSANLLMEQSDRIREVYPSFHSKTSLHQYRALTVRFYRELLALSAGLLIPAIAIYAFILIPNLSEGPLGVPILPTTARVTGFMGHSALKMIIMMLITIIAGQLVWGERDSRQNEISDTLPVSNSVILLSKYSGITFWLITLLAALMVTGFAIQVNGGNSKIEFGKYIAVLLGTQLLDYLLFAAAAMAIHTIVNQKYIGHLVTLVFYFYTLKPSIFGIEHNLLIFGSATPLPTSTFFGQGPFLLPWILFKLYWIGWAVLLMITAKHMWMRGREDHLKNRLTKALKRLKRAPVSVITFLFIFLTGSIIFYNTNVLNDYQTGKEGIKQQVEYERLYSRYKAILQPALINTKLHIELYPEKRHAIIQGAYRFINKSKEKIDSIHLTPATAVITDDIQFDRNAQAVLVDEKLGYQIYALEQSLLPGDSLQLNFKVQFKDRGFSNRGIKTAVINNGSYFMNTDWLPAIGYQSQRELEHEGMRKNYKLAEKEALPSPLKVVDMEASPGSERIKFEATVGTAGDQIAIAPGLLKNSWSKNGRMYFHYVTEHPILNMYHVYSAKYKAREVQANGIDFRIFHHPQSVLNLERIEKSMISSMDYFSRSFGAYPSTDLRFVEYADPGTGGISLPGSVGYSTNFALLHTEQDRRKFDHVTAVVAHEVAHQWWGHQLNPANAAGAPLLTESLAWYSAFGVVEQVYGTAHLRKLLDAMREEYLNPRSRAAVPLLLAVDGFQAYRKGPFAMYALREYVGEKMVNNALKNLLHKFKSGNPPLATSFDFYEELKKETPDSLRYLLKDLFETNSFWELQTKKAITKQTVDGNWLVTIDVHAKKVRVSEAGLINEVPMNDLIEIGVFGGSIEGDAEPLYLKKQIIHSGINRIIVKVSRQPEEAGIDPRNLLIDTETYNNVRQVSTF
ncbi:MAG TPA: M1 family aminopeptidase, partial [Chitinophagaceae bacterium]|nr:M1 family aminopeptidase [Chitinophagaceae bacterium]